MARVTIQDCLGKIPNRFELVLCASRRAQQLMLSGDEPFVPEDRDKPVVLALREIAAGYAHPDAFGVYNIKAPHEDDLTQEL